MLREGGANTGYSLGKTQMAFWGLLVTTSFLGVFVISHKMERIPQNVLILLGISGATGLSSVLITGSKRSAAGPKIQELEDARLKLIEQQKEPRAKIAADSKSLQDEKSAAGANFPPEKQKQLDVLNQSLNALEKALADADQAIEAQRTEAAVATSEGKWYKDIISDANGMTFHRFQVVLWTIILGIVFIWTVCNTLSMPEFDTTLLLLMGISNGTYLGFKFPEKQG